jgi:serpin B
VALLPNNDVSIDDYILSLTGDKFINLVKNAENTEVSAGLPKFKYDFELTMNDILFDMGIKDAFNSADFSKMSDQNLYIGEVKHKTYIAVDEKGTKAGAVSSVRMDKASASITGPKSVILDRPFVYAIVDSSTSLPMFMGSVMYLK